MGSSCSSGSKKDKCSKKKKLPCLPFRLESNGANRSPRGSNASNSSAYAYQKSPEANAALGAANAAGDEGTAPLLPHTSSDASATNRPAPLARPLVERMDSHSAVSVSSPMSPNQLTRQATKDGAGDSAGSRPDLLNALPDDVRTLLTGWAPTDLQLAPSPRTITLVLCRNGCGRHGLRQTESEREYEQLQDRVLQPLQQHCLNRGYQMRCLLVDEDAPRHQWSWVAAEQPHSPPVLLLLVATECERVAGDGCALPARLPRPTSEQDVLQLAPYYELDENEVQGALVLVQEPEETERADLEEKLRQLFPEHVKTGFEWLAEAVCSSAALRARSVCVWKRRLQSPHDLTPLQQRLLEGAEDTKLIKCTLRWQLPVDGAAERTDEAREAEEVYLRDVCAQLVAPLTATADSLLDEVAAADPVAFATPRYLGVSRELYTELVEQTRVAQELLASLPPPSPAEQQPEDDVTLSAVRAYLLSDRPWPLVVHGAAGAGKSRVAARTVQLCCARWMPNAHLVFRFARHTPHSRSVERLLTSLLEQCCLLLGEPPPTAGMQATDLPSVLQRLAPTRPLVVLLDGLDFLDQPSLLPPSASSSGDDGSCPGLSSCPSSPSSALRWLPSLLPDNIRLVLTVTDPSPLVDYLRHFLSFEERGQAGFVHLPPLNPEQANLLLRHRLLAHGRQITAQQQLACEADVARCPNPKYVALVANCAATWRSSRPTEDLLLAADLRGQAHALLTRLEQELDSSLVRLTLAYLLLAKHGLSPAELGALLPRPDQPSPGDRHHHSEAAWQRTVDHLLRTLQHQLAPTFLRTVLVGQHALLICTCNALRDACRSRYLGDNATTATFVEQLREYWEGAPLRLGGRLNRRKLDELPRLCGVPAERFLFDWDWLHAKLQGSGVREVLDDAALAQPTTAETERLRQLLRAAATALEHDGRQFFTQVHARLVLPAAEDNDDDQFPHLRRLLELVETTAPDNCLLSPVAGGCLHDDEDEDEDAVTPASEEGGAATALDSAALATSATLGTTLHRIKDNAGFVVTLRAGADELAVWSVYEQREERRLCGVPQPRDVRFADGHRAVVLCGRELRVYDVDAGALEMRVKGVMNQTMAYYDLHDAAHVVALSRNRMYVNMTRIAAGSGECVATFKVGEDRFLNSLLVSGDGRVCVCGDETQKPFPLLVWDLVGRRLLYDLRIPYHDFVTSLSAITGDGHYVVCVCQEVSDPSPNFIIVYDLQNGTLFKKWKPEVSTCSVAISSEGGCVVTGLLDTSVLVWNLTTGACSFTLLGHTAPVTFIRMDAAGRRCLTADLPRARDPAIFLWDLATGTCLSSFMCERPISSCELTQDGGAVVLALADRAHILSLVLVERGGSLAEATPTSQHYGNPDHLGRRVQLTD